mgnify:FL=1
MIINDINIGFIGLGKLGLECAEVFAEHYNTYGYDIYTRDSNSVKICETIEETINNSDWIFIAVQTPHEEEYDGGVPSAHLDPRDFDYNIVKEVLTDINKYADKSKNIVLISTVLPGTTRREFDELLDNHTLIYNPYLIAMGSVAWDMVNPEMVIIGSKDANDSRVGELIDIYKPLMENDPRYETGTWEEAEAIKIFYNTMLSTKIGLVNMFQDFAMKIGHIDIDVVTNALSNSTLRVISSKYMSAGLGDAGPCHPRDNIALRWLAKEYNLGYDMFDTIMHAREVQAKNLANFLVAQSELYELPIVIHGKAYKPDVPYTIGSYSILIGYYITEVGHDVLYVDPLTNDELESMQAVVLLAHNRKITYGYTGNEEKDRFYFDIKPGSVLVDPWRKMDLDNTTYRVVHYGNTR